MTLRNVLKRLFMELFKISPYLLLVLGCARALGDTSQLYLTAYWLIVICATALVAHIARKFMYPSFSMEAHMHAARAEKNVASAIVVAVMMLFQLVLCWLVVICVIAMVAAPPKFATSLQGASQVTEKAK